MHHTLRSWFRAKRGRTAPYHSRHPVPRFFRPTLETLETCNLLSGFSSAAAATLGFSTYLGGTGGDAAAAIAVDASGNVYVTGATGSSDFPITTGAPQQVLLGFEDAFVSKFSPSGALEWSTYLGGSGLDQGKGIAVDPSGNVYVTGITASQNFPTTQGAPQTHLAGVENAFVSEFTPAGALAFSTYLGGSGAGSDQGNAIAVDASGHVFVTGGTSSTDFPTTPGVVQPHLAGGADAFVTELDTTQTGSAALVYSTYQGGENADGGNAIAVNPSGNAYIAGSTASVTFPTTAGAFQSAFNGFGGSLDTFVAKLSPGGTTRLYSSYLGGSSLDEGNGIAVDASGNAYLTGQTTSSDFPTLGSIQPFGTVTNQDVFVTKLDTTKAGASGLVWSTFLGGSEDDAGTAIAVDGSGNVDVTGQTLSSIFPTTAGAFQSQLGGLYDAFVVQLSASGALSFSTYLGGRSSDFAHGIAVDASGTVYLAGGTGSSDFPITPGAFQTTLHGSNAFVTTMLLPGSSGGGGGGGAGGGGGGGGSSTGATAVTSAPLINPTLQQAAHGYVLALDQLFLTADGVLFQAALSEALVNADLASGGTSSNQAAQAFLSLEQATLAADALLLEVDAVFLSVEQVFSSVDQNTLSVAQALRRWGKPSRASIRSRKPWSRRPWACSRLR
jgi:hypothetical protein